MKGRKLSFTPASLLAHGGLAAFLNEAAASNDGTGRLRDLDAGGAEAGSIALTSFKATTQIVKWAASARTCGSSISRTTARPTT